MKLYKYKITTVLLLLFSLGAYGQIIKLPFEELVNKSRLIVEGKVIAKEGFKKDGFIYTSNTFEVEKVLKGSIEKTEIIIITDGGRVGNSIQVTEPSSHYELGNRQVVMLIKSKISKNLEQSYKEYAMVQSTFDYDQTKRQFKNVYDTFDEAILYREIEKNTHQKPVIFGKPSNKNLLLKSTTVAEITNLSPSTITAGTRSVLTITGTGFGTTVGTIGFSNANKGGTETTFIIPTPVISWTDTEIKVNVPVFAGTGSVFVNGVSSGTNIITVPYAINAPGDDSFNPYLPILVNNNNLGGYTWQMSTEFAADMAAKASFMRAFNNIRCTTKANWIIGANSTINTGGNDGVNLIYFDDDNKTVLGAGGLGVCSIYYDVCGTDAIVKGLDIIFKKNNTFDASFSWNYTTAACAGNQFDFETTALHELLHGNGLTHVNDSSDTMFYSRTNETQQRVITNNALQGTQYMLSNMKNLCGLNGMILYDCYPCGTPVAQFNRENVSSSVSTRVCVGSSIKFIDQSFCSNNTTRKVSNADYGTVSYNWIFANNAGTTYTSTSATPTITFNTSGSYDVTLQLTNSNGTSTPVTKIGYVQVFSSNISSACVPSSIVNSGNTYDIGVGNVTFGTINYNSSGYTNDGGKFYIDHTSEACTNPNMITDLTIGQATTLTASVANNAHNIKAYIDYNNNGVFDVATETVLLGNNIDSYHSISSVVTPPQNTVLNTPLRMRIIADYIGAGDPEPCNNPAYGQVEDFMVFIRDNVPTCPNNLTITTNVVSPNSDTQQASQNITATNTINSGATANYHAGIDVLLKDGFVAVNGSDFRAYIQGCTGTVTAEKSSEPKTTMPVEKEKMFAIYPNPSTGIFTIEVEKNIQQYNIDIFSSDGRIIYQTKSKETKQSVDISNFPSGLYLVIVSTQEGKRYSQKIIKK